MIASLNSARAKARDAKRKSDLRTIATALEMYYNEHGTYIISGTGWDNTGKGFFSNNRLPNVTKSIAKGLVDLGLVSTEIIDPSGAREFHPRTGYVLEANSEAYTIWASLENPSAQDIATMNNCKFSNYDNFRDVSVSQDKATNYCISN